MIILVSPFAALALSLSTVSSEAFLRWVPHKQVASGRFFGAELSDVACDHSNVMKVVQQTHGTIAGSWP